MVDKLLAILPPYLSVKNKRAYLTLGTSNDGWQAAYVFPDGFAFHPFESFGEDLVETLLLLQEQINLLNILNIPSTQKE